MAGFGSQVVNDPIDLQRYFDRIGYQGPRTPALETLAALMLAHVQSIPFENLDVLLGRPIRLEPEALFGKLVAQRRGGYCFEQNGLFMEVLIRLGFAVRPLRAAVRLGQPDRSVAAGHTHLALEVTVAGRRWLADVGVGAASLSQPLAWAADLVQPTLHETRRLQQEAGVWYHQVQRAAGWIDVYEFGGETLSAPDRAIANWYTSTHPDSVFRRRLTVTRALPGGGRVSLDARELTWRHASGAVEVRPVASPAGRRAALRQHFGIELPSNAHLRLP